MESRNISGSAFGLFDKTKSDELEIIRLKKNITENLTILKFSDDTIHKIFNTVENMRGSSQMIRALNFLTQLTSKTGYDEKFYQYSNHIAEYFCTISNLGFFAVSWMYKDYSVLIAGIFSALSHAIPLKILNDLDKIAACGLFLKAISHYDVLLDNPIVLASGAAALTMGGLGGVAKKNLDRFGATPHVLWHLLAAFALYKLNQAIYDVPEMKFQPTYRI